MNQKGQTLVFILLISVVGLTLGLAMAGRSISRVTQTQETEDYNRAFSAAEAGLEDVALQIKEDSLKLTQTFSGVGSLSESGATYEYNCKPVNSQNYVNLEPITKDEVGQVNLKIDENAIPPLYTTGTIRVCWKAASPASNSASLVLSLITRLTIPDPTRVECVDNYCLSKSAVNPGGIVRDNGFASATANLCSGYDYGTTINIPGGEQAQLLRIRAMYNQGAPVSVRVEAPTSQFGFQYQECTATGTSGDNVAKEKFTISHPILPAIFDYVLFSGSTANPLTHQ